MRELSRRYLGLALVGIVLSAPAAAQVKFAYIDPLSGGAASAGINAQKHMTYLVDRLNAAGGLNGEKVELLSYDNKVDPQESLIALKKALDDGARFVFQGNGSAVALAITDAVLKYNERNPGKEVLYFNYAAVDPVLTNEKCNFWHFRFDDDADMKMAALTDAIARQSQIKSVYLINQDYSFGRAVAVAAKKMLAEKRPDIKIVGDELHPLQKVQDFSPYVAKIKASGADTVITGNWSNDMLLLIKAGKDAGLKVNWYTYYGGSLGAPSAIGKDGVGTVKQISAAAAAKAKSNDPVKLARALEGIKVTTSVGDAEMRADNHQILQPMFVSTLSENVKFDVEKTGLGFKTDVKINAKDTALPTTCKMQRPA
jgi:branched-chain amino acid transport system substrate-binding protein